MVRVEFIEDRLAQIRTSSARLMSKKAKLFIIAAAAATLLLLSVFIPRMGTYLVAEHDLIEADALVILMGSVPARALEGAEVYREGFVRDIIVVQTHVESEELLAERGVKIPGQAELTSDALTQMGVPIGQIEVLPGRVRSTWEEAQVVCAYLADNREIDSLILVTSSFHTRRTLIIFERACRSLNLDREIELIIRPSSFDAFQAERWWQDRESAKRVVLEYMKLAYFLAWEQWR